MLICLVFQYNIVQTLHILALLRPANMGCKGCGANATGNPILIWRKK